jgi:hypothetical protein
MNEFQPSSARADHANRAARRNYFVMSVVAIVVLAAPVFAFIVSSD